MSKPLDKLPPNSREAEQGALGCLLLDPSKTAVALKAGVNPRWFYELRHAELFSVLAEMARNGGGDSVTVAIRLRERGKLDAVGGVAYLAELQNVTPSAENLSYYLPELEDCARRRTILEASTRLAMLAEDQTSDSESLLGDVEAVVANFRRGAGDALPAITDATDLIAEPMTEPRELVAGILHQGSKLVLGGGSKSFKTLSLLDLAISVSHGAPWLSFDTTKGRVLYLNMELPPWSFRQRIAEVAKAKALPLLPGQLAVWNLRGRAAGFDVLFPKIKTEIKDAGHTLIVLDPIYKLYGKTDENAAGDVAALMNAVEDLSVTTGAAVAFGAHFSKGNQAGKEAIDRISGSGVFARDPDSILSLTKHEAEDAFTLECTLRNFRPVEPFVVRWQFPLLHRDGTLDPSRLKQVGGRKQEYDAGQLLEVLPASGLDNMEWLEKAADEHGITERTFYRLRAELCEGGKVLKSKINGKWMPVTKTR